ICVIWIPISSIWPANITRGLPLPFNDATELPCTSARTSSANFLTSSRHTRAGACSNPEGPAVLSSFFKKSTVFVICLLLPQPNSVQQEPQNGEHDQSHDRRGCDPAQRLMKRDFFREPFGRHAARAAPARDRRHGDSANR